MVHPFPDPLAQTFLKPYWFVTSEPVSHRKNWATQENYDHLPSEVLSPDFGVLLGCSDSCVSPTFLRLTFRVAAGSPGRWLWSPNRPSLNPTHHPGCVTLDKLLNLSELVSFSVKVGGMTVSAS